MSEEVKLMNENKCWTCEIPLLHLKKSKWKCGKCNDVYFSCKRCEKEEGHPSSYDHDENDKGMICDECGFHYCAVCWQHTGHLGDGLHAYTCETCE